MAYIAKWFASIAEVNAAAWDALASPVKTPFLEWDWLHQMEASGSIAPYAGWWPRHLTIWSGGQLIGAAPLYIKSHSSGEFVFDYIWADVADRLGTGYYPKLLGMSPVTPVPGYRFLIAPGEDAQALQDFMFHEIDRFCRQRQIAGCSFLFVDPDTVDTFSGHGFSAWIHQSFRWDNRAYQDFEDYLSEFNANQRHNIRRERKKLGDLKIRIHTYAADEIPEAYMPLMYRFYERTNDKFGPWGCKFLTPGFFDGIYRCFRHRLLLTAAFQGNGQRMPVGMALLLYKDDQLYGRYWGSVEDVRMLHFNACYYSPIQWAIKHRIRSYDPGIGSPHKIRRGFAAIPNYSLHRFYDPYLQHVWDTHIGRINQGELDTIAGLNRQLPFAHQESE
jgi:predicted N-acyltransferase